jgi:hypothetical protein
MPSVKSLLKRLTRVQAFTLTVLTHRQACTLTAPTLKRAHTIHARPARRQKVTKAGLIPRDTFEIF